MIQENQGVMELLEKMAQDNAAQNRYLRKQLFFTRIFAVSGCILTVALLLVALKVMPPLLGAVDKAVTALDQATGTLVVVDDTLQQASDTLADVQTLFEEDGLVGQSSVALQQATDKISQMDIESLNAAIKDLGEVVEPLAEFFGKFKR